MLALPGCSKYCPKLPWCLIISRFRLLRTLGGKAPARKEQMGKSLTRTPHAAGGGEHDDVLYSPLPTSPVSHPTVLSFDTSLGNIYCGGIPIQCRVH